ncbi:FliM/FliN family flagellar motor switch protein [Roseivivax sp. CAU 1761]
MSEQTERDRNPGDASPRSRKTAARATAPETAPEPVDAAAGADFGAAIPELEDPEALPAPPEEAAAAGKSGHTIQAMFNVDLEVKVVLGECRMPISQLLKLARGSVIDLDQRIGEPVDLVVNDRLVARGDLVKLPGERIGVSLTEIVRDHVGDL